MIDLCTLGTGGTMPLPDRALASLYVRVGGRAVLVDCGEGTQIGIQRLSWGIQCIDAILLTHYHADHCSGLPGMLLAITKAGRTAPLHIYGPIGLERVVAGLRVIAPSLSCPIVLHEIIDDYSPFASIGLTITPFPLRHEMPCIGYQFHLPRPALFDPIRARAQGIPVKLWAVSGIDVGVEYGRRGYNVADRLGLVRQQYFKFSVGFSLFAGAENGEYWFRRPKYD